MLSQADGVQLWSVLSRNSQRAAEFASRHGAHSANPGHTSLETLLDDPDLHGVIVATPDKLHASQAMMAARAGKHVLVEKPMATSIDEAMDLIRQCEAAEVTLGVAYHLRWHAGHRMVAEAVGSRAFGDIRHMRVQWTFFEPDATNWRASPEMGRWWSLAAVGTHCLDLIRWLMVPTCGEVASLERVISRSVWHGPHDETAIAALKFESGATAEFCSSVLFQAPTRMEVYGDVGYAICTDTLGPRGRGTVWTHEGELHFSPTNPFVGELTDFASAIRDRRPPEVDGREGLCNVELLARIGQ